jgi:eukaryotic-like serine/threonine-protein kinase
MAYDDYEVLELIAEGTRSTIHRARDRRSGLAVALKRLGDDSGFQEWEREVVALEKISSVNVVQLLESGRLDRGGYLALEWIEGQTLDAKATQQSLTLDEFVVVASCSLRALHAVHGAQFLHRDVTPANLMQASDGTWKLIDFGQARLMGDASQQALVGSVHCMAPEQFENGMLDECTDFYALGCTLHFALTGRFAHAGGTTAEVIASHLYPEPPRLEQIRPDLPAAVIAWVGWLMSRQPPDRPQSCWDALNELLSVSFDSRS